MPLGWVKPSFLIGGGGGVRRARDEAYWVVQRREMEGGWISPWVFYWGSSFWLLVKAPLT